MVKWITKHNIHFWALSFVIAITLWIYVTVMLDPEILTTISNIPVVYTNGDVMESAELALMETEETISITFEGKRTDLNALTNKTVAAVASLSDVKQNGITKLFYELDGPRQLGSVKINQAPSYVTVRADKLITREIPVELTLNVSPAENFSLEEERLNPAVITMRGPESLVTDIAKARVEYSQSEPLSGSYEKVLDYTLYDIRGTQTKKSASISVDTDKVTLSQRVVMVKEVPFRINTVDGGGLTREYLDFTFEPRTVVLKGDAALLESMNSLNIGTISLSSLLDDKTFEYSNISAQLPEGVVNAGGVEDVTAVVKIIGAPKRDITVGSDSFELTNSRVPEGYMIRFMTTQLTVTIRGPETSVAMVERHNISVTVDMPEGELSPQTYTRNAKVTVNGYADVGVPDYEYTVSVAVVPVPVTENGDGI